MSLHAWARHDDDDDDDDDDVLNYTAGQAVKPRAVSAP